ncbi:MAG: hydroxymethylglutaryl-CoA synthase [Acidobacteriota bacterium]
MTANPTRPSTTGIASIGLSLPPLALPVEELAKLRGQDPQKFTLGLGCREMALCPPDFGAVEMAVAAARRALGRWDGDLERIGMIAVGTESAVDMSRPLSAWVADELGLRGAVRSYEVKHACYGGTVGLRQALEWKLSGAAGGTGTEGKAALVIATDVALYALEDPGEPTQGAGAVAMIVDQPDIAAIDPISHPWSEPAFDFWRPVGESFPRVDGKFSLDCYKQAAEHCFQAFVGDSDADSRLAELAAICFHVPFPKMVKKAFLHVGESFGLDFDRTNELFAEKIDPNMGWNRLCGNAYTASLWMSVAEALAGRAAGDQIAAFSYGSGFGSELLTLTAGPKAARGAWSEDVEQDLGSRELIDAARYEALRTAPAA